MSWNAAVFNKLHSMKPSLGDWQSSSIIDRKEEVTLARLRIGHTFITHSFLSRLRSRSETYVLLFRRRRCRRRCRRRRRRRKLFVFRSFSQKL